MADLHVRRLDEERAEAESEKRDLGRAPRIKERGLISLPWSAGRAKQVIPDDELHPHPRTAKLTIAPPRAPLRFSALAARIRRR